MQLLTKNGNDVAHLIKEKLETLYLRLEAPTEIDHATSIRTEIRVLKELMLVFGYRCELEIKIMENKK